MSLLDDLLLTYICCPKCKTDLYRENNSLICKKCNNQYEIIDDNILKVIPDITKDIELSIQKWDTYYRDLLNSEFYKKEYNYYVKTHKDKLLQQLIEYKPLHSNLIFLEIGCGAMFTAQEISEKVGLVIGIDFSPSALIIAKRMFESKGVKNYLLIQADILNMPLKTGIVDLIYGGGVIEHFKNTQQCVNELYRVLKNGGVSFNAVPYLNIGTLLYRQIWGNIPNLPILRELAEFVHIKLLKAKHMTYGYELSFLGTTLRKIHQRAGFLDIKVKKLDWELVFEFIPKRLRKNFIWLANSSRLFWPTVKVIAKK